jgi:hypothetical protein
LKSLVAGGETLKTVIIAVMDTGINMEHKIFEGRILTAHARNFAADVNADLGTNDLRDNLGHGTHTAGTISDMTLPNVKILPIKIFGSTNTTSAKFVSEAVNYLVSLKRNGLNIAAVNMSLGTDPLNPDADAQEYASNKSFYQNCINALVSADILPIVAVGNGPKTNNGNGLPYPSFPSACSGTVSVSGFSLNQFINYDKNYNGVEDPGEVWIDTDGKPETGNENGRESNSAFLIQRARYANYVSGYDSRVDITAPGGYNEVGKVGIWSAANTGTDTVSRLEGTSMAAPFVTALYALLCSDPTKSSEDWQTISGGWTASDSENYLTPIQKVLFNSAVPLGQAETRMSYFGRGCVSVAALVDEEAFEEWFDPAAYEDAMNTVPDGMTKITVQPTGGGAVLQDDYIPIGEYVLADTESEFSVWVTAGGGYSILKVLVGGQEVSSSLTGTEYVNGKLVCGKYTFASLPGSAVAVVVQFSTFSTDQVNYTKTTKIDTAPDDTDFATLLLILLGVGGLIAAFYFIRNRKPKELSIQSLDGETEPDADAEVDRIIKIMEKRGRPKGTDLDEEIAAIMREIKTAEEEGEDYE